jgi:curved DNA-binding protein
MNFYTELGVSETATQDEIKKAYRKLAATHHPDRGGDTAAFQKIAQAYDTIGDEQKRAAYDSQQRGGGNPFNFTGEHPFNVDEMFGGGGGPFAQFFRHAQGGQPQQRRKNRDLSIRCKISFAQSFTGTNIEATYPLPTGVKETVVITVPEGIQNGQTIRYGGMGDNSDTNLPRGDLNVTIMVENSQDYERRGDHLVSLLLINPIEAMVGCTKSVNHLNGNEIKINLRPGVQHGAEFVSQGLGFKNMQGQRGHLIILVGIKVPAIIDPLIKEELERAYSKIS